MCDFSTLFLTFICYVSRMFFLALWFLLLPLLLPVVLGVLFVFIVLLLTGVPLRGTQGAADGGDSTAPITSERGGRSVSNRLRRRVALAIVRKRTVYGYAASLAALVLIGVIHNSLCGVPVITGTPPGVRITDLFWDLVF